MTQKEPLRDYGLLIIQVGNQKIRDIYEMRTVLENKGFEQLLNFFERSIPSNRRSMSKEVIEAVQKVRTMRDKKQKYYILVPDIDMVPKGIREQATEILREWPEDVSL